MHPTDVCAWVLANGSEMPDTLGRRCFRCSARLWDGTHLPCVVVREVKASLDLLVPQIRARCANASDDSDLNLESLVRATLLGGSHVSVESIASLHPCPYAIPWALLDTLPGEVDWGPLTFVGVMNDGVEFVFHTAGSVGFFHMPEGYTGAALTALVPVDQPIAGAHRERDAFAVLVDGADFGALPTRAPATPSDR
jgi:hypothetical protein